LYLFILINLFIYLVSHTHMYINKEVDVGIHSEKKLTLTQKEEYVNL